MGLTCPDGFGSLKVQAVTFLPSVPPRPNIPQLSVLPDWQTTSDDNRRKTAGGKSPSWRQPLENAGLGFSARMSALNLHDNQSV